jgi:hypothetical protein
VRRINATSNACGVSTACDGLRRLCVPVALAALLALTGCSGDAPQVYRVTGTATRGGKPVPNLSVNFLPEVGRPSFAQTDSKGRYKLGFTREIDGALPGKHKVVVAVPIAGPGPTEAISKADLQAILAKYGSRERTALEVQVTKDGQDIELKLD